MEKSHADAIAQAILEPDLKAQEETRRKRAAEAQRSAERRLVARCALPCLAIGSAIAYLTGDRISIGAIWGGIAGAILGWAIVGWRSQRVAP